MCITPRTKPSAAWNSTGFRKPATCRWWRTCPRNILSRPARCSRFGLIYAGAQKNIGPAGLSIVIVREDLLGQALPGTPTMLDYKIHADNDSMYNTPPTYSHLHRRPGVQVAEAHSAGWRQWSKRNNRQGRRCFTITWTAAVSTIARWPKTDRSRMNVPFTLKDAALDEEFLKQSKARGLAATEGPPLGGRDARLDLQPHAAGRGAGAGGLHARVRAETWIRNFHSTAPASMRSTSEMLKLVNQRAEHAKAIGDLKNGAVYRPEREAQVLRRIKEEQPRAAFRRDRGAPVPRNHVGLPGAGEASVGGVPRAAGHLHPGGGHQAIRPCCTNPCLRLDRRSVPRSGSGRWRITAWCRWKTPPAARSALPWICCCRRRSGCAAKSTCGCTSFCCARRGQRASRTRSIPMRSPSRSAMSG